MARTKQTARKIDGAAPERRPLPPTTFRPSANSSYSPAPELGMQSARSLPNPVPEPRLTPIPYHPISHQAAQTMRVLPNTTPEQRPTPRAYRPQTETQAQMERDLPDITPEPRPIPTRRRWGPYTHEVGQARQTLRVLPSTTPETRPAPIVRAEQRCQALPSTTSDPRPAPVLRAPPPIQSWEYYGIGPPPSDPSAYVEWSGQLTARLQQMNMELMEKLKRQEEGDQVLGHQGSDSGIGVVSNGDSQSQISTGGSSLSSLK